MSYRSEANYIANKLNYKDLRMTQYPNALDTRENNANMRGFVNIGESDGIPDFVMAEYTNALIDAVMAIQRTLGESPSVYYGADLVEFNDLIENSTVDSRLTRIEDGLFDERYGGEGWADLPVRPTINNHSHTGVNGQPPRIDLVDEVVGLLHYSNLNLDYQDGLTGANISLSPYNATKLDVVVAGLLSKSEGGTVTGPTYFTGPVKTRTHIDATAVDITNKGQSEIISDTMATSGRALTTTNTTSQKRLLTINANEKEHLLYGRYILGLRVKKTLDTEESFSLLNVSMGSLSESFNQSNIGNDYKTIHYIFEHNHLNKNENLNVIKPTTIDAAEVRLDSYYITPIHPATLDR